VAGELVWTVVVEAMMAVLEAEAEEEEDPIPEEEVVAGRKTSRCR